MKADRISYRPVAGYFVRVEGAPARARLSGIALALAWTAGFVTGAMVTLFAR